MCLIEHVPASRPGTGYKVYEGKSNPKGFFAKYGTTRYEIGQTYITPQPTGYYHDLIDAQGFHIVTKLEDARVLRARLEQHEDVPHTIVKVCYKQTLWRGYTQWFNGHCFHVPPFKHRTVLAKEMTLIGVVE